MRQGEWRERVDRLLDVVFLDVGIGLLTALEQGVPFGFQLTVPGGANDIVQALAMYDGSTIFAPSSSPIANATRAKIS